MTFDWSSQIRDGRGNQAALECWSLAWGVLSHLSHLALGEAGIQFKSVFSHNSGGMARELAALEPEPITDLNG